MIEAIATGASAATVYQAISWGFNLLQERRWRLAAEAREDDGIPRPGPTMRGSLDDSDSGVWIDRQIRLYVVTRDGRLYCGYVGPGTCMALGIVAVPGDDISAFFGNHGHREIGEYDTTEEAEAAAIEWCHTSAALLDCECDEVAE